jgi:hypothetical protein
VERHMRPLKDCASANRKVSLASVAAVEPTLAGRNAFPSRACRASHTIRPKSRFQIEPRGFRIWDQVEQLECADCTLAHVQILLNSLTGVKYIIPQTFRFRRRRSRRQ